MQKCITKVTHESCFFAHSSWLWGSGGLPEAASKRGSKKTSKSHFRQSVLGSYSGTFFDQNRIRRHLLGVYFYACFWHCFCHASGTNLVHFCVILQLCWCCCKTAKMQHILSENLVFRGAGPSFSQHFRNLFEAFFGVAVKVAFWDMFCRFGHPRGPCLS